MGQIPLTGPNSLAARTAREKGPKSSIILRWCRILRFSKPCRSSRNSAEAIRRRSWRAYVAGEKNCRRRRVSLEVRTTTDSGPDFTHPRLEAQNRCRFARSFVPLLLGLARGPDSATRRTVRNQLRWRSYRKLSGERGYIVTSTTPSRENFVRHSWRESTDWRHKPGSQFRSCASNCMGWKGAEANP